MLQRAKINRRLTAPNNPQADGLAERAVQTVKRALCKVMEGGQQEEWDEAALRTTLGYNCSAQESTKIPPHHVIFAQTSTISPATVTRFEGPAPNNLVYCAPCHLPDIDPAVDHCLAKPDAKLPCKVCHFPEPEDTMLLCDACRTGWHMECMDASMKEVPRGIWVCPQCSADSVSTEHVSQANMEEERIVAAPVTTQEKEAPAAASPRKRSRPARK